MNFRLLVVVAMLGGSYLPSRAGPDFHSWQERPAMGWNSWDIFGTTVTERQVREQADAMATRLLPSGYDILTVDIQWYEPNAKGHVYNPGAELSMDEHGRLIPAVNRFPSSANGKGFKPLADHVHSKGLRFGIHIMRGIPRQAVERNTPVAGTKVRARDISVAVKGGKRLVLFVRDGGDGFEHDHAVWVDPLLSGPKGRLNLTELKWTDATAGWGQPRVNRTCEGQPLLVVGKPVEGIGTHSESRIIYDLPEGCETFTAKGVMTRGGSVVFGVLVDRNTGDNSDEAEVGVDLADIGIPGKATVRDLWAKKEIGSFEGRFSRKIRMHGAGLYRVSPPR